MTTTRPTPLSDDYGDRFPDALTAPEPAPTTPETPARLVRMRAAYVHKVNAVLASGDDGLAYEPARTFDEESGGRQPGTQPTDRRSAGRHAPTRGRGGRSPGRVGRFTRRSLARFDRYTLDVFNAGVPLRPRDDRSA
jgi:hypothetical protein